MALVAVTLLKNVVHEHLRAAGETLQLEEEHAHRLVDEGLAEFKARKSSPRKAAAEPSGDGAEGE